MDVYCVPENDLQPDANFKDDLGGDSLDHADLIRQCEDEFKIEIDAFGALELTTVGKAIAFLEDKTGK